MKKILLSIILSVLSVSAFAQLKSIEIMGEYRAGIIGPKGDPGIGLGATIELAENFDIAPRFNLYLPSSGSRFTIEADAHYNFTELNDNFYLYPLVGGGVFHSNWKDDAGESHNRNKVLINGGAGIGFPLNENFTAFGEIKYQLIAGENSDSGTYLTVGISYCF